MVSLLHPIIMINGIPFAFKNACFEWVDFRGELGAEPQKESTLARFYYDALREKMPAENEYSWTREA
ncbi:MAG: hypothetical protein V3V31_03815 [Methylococcales bacterium]